MTPEQLKELIQTRELVEVERIPSEPFDKDEYYLLLTFAPEFETDEN